MFELVGTSRYRIWLNVTVFVPLLMAVTVVFKEKAATAVQVTVSPRRILLVEFTLNNLVPAVPDNVTGASDVCVVLAVTTGVLFDGV